MKNKSDLELIELYNKSDDKSIVVELYKRYSRHIMAICYNYLGKNDWHEDAATEIYEKLTRELKNRSFETKQSFVNWLAVISKNHCISHLRKLKSIKNTAENYKYHLEFVEFSSHERSLTKEELNEISINSKLLKKAIDSLPEHQKKCLCLFYFKGYKITDKIIKKLEHDLPVNILQKLNILKNIEFRGEGFFYDKLSELFDNENEISFSSDEICNFKVKILNEAYFSDRLSYKEINKYTNYSLKEIKSFIQNGKLNLKKRLKVI